MRRREGGKAYCAPLRRGAVAEVAVRRFVRWSVEVAGSAPFQLGPEKRSPFFKRDSFVKFLKCHRHPVKKPRVSSKMARSS